MIGAQIDDRYLRRMTDDTGMLQFARGSRPDRGSGYTVDDNARALLVALQAGEGLDDLAEIYARFMLQSQNANGHWRNWMIGDSYLKDIDSEDADGRAFLAAAAATVRGPEEVRSAGRMMVARALPHVSGLEKPRGVAYLLIAASTLLQSGSMAEYRQQLEEIADRGRERLIGLYRAHQTSGWHWFEPQVTYCNGILPHALLEYCRATGDREALQVAEDTLQWLADHLYARGYLSLVGSSGWWQQGKEIPPYDQQPVDACSMALAAAAAAELTGKDLYREMVRMAGSWFTGDNINRLSLYDSQSGGCCDGLIPGGLNHNQGAESLLSLLLTWIQDLQRPAWGNRPAD